MPGILTGPGIQSVGGHTELAQFANAVASQTGLDPRVVEAWALLETGGQPYGGFHNWLNLRPYPGDPYIGVSPGNFEEYSSVQQAITATVRRLRQPFASGILRSAGSSPAQEISAIAASGWDAGHYGGPGGPSLVHEFESLFGSSALGSPAQKGSKVGTIPGSAGTGIVGAGSTLGGIAHTAADVLTFPERAFKFLTSWRFVEVLGGFLLLLVGLYLLGRQFGVSAPVPAPVATAARRTEDVSDFAGPPGEGSEAHYRASRAYTGGRAPRRERISTEPTPVYSTRSRQAA